MRKIILFTLAIALTSCVVKPYKSPQMSAKLDSLSKLLVEGSEPAENIEAFPWQEIYTDPLLQGYIKEALEHNHDIEKARLSIQQAYSYLRSARAAYSPTFSASAAAKGEAKSENLFAGGVGLTGQASWEIEIWGKMTAAKRAKKAQVISSINNLQALQSAIISETANAYYSLIASDLEREVIISTIDNRKQYLDTVTLMKKYGKVNEVAVQQAAATLSDVQTYLPKVELSIVQTENALAVLIGKPSRTEIKRANNIDLSSTKLFDKLPSGILRNRPDVRAAEQSYRSAFELWNVARAAMYPSLNLSLEGGFSDIFHSQILLLNSVASLTQPIWNGRKLRTEKEVADLEKRKAEVTFEQTVLNAGAEVSNAYTSMIKYKDIASKEKNVRDSYAKAYDYSYELFLNGYATYLDVLVAQQGVFSSDITLIQSYYNTISAQITLYRTMGGGADNNMVEKQAIELAKNMSKKKKK